MVRFFAKGSVPVPVLVVLAQILCQGCIPKPDDNGVQPTQVGSALPDRFPYEKFGGALSETERDAQIAVIRSKISDLDATDYAYAEDLTDAVEARMRSTSQAAYVNRSEDRLTLTVQLRDGTPWFFNSGRSFPPNRQTRQPVTLDEIPPGIEFSPLASPTSASSASSALSASTAAFGGPTDDSSNKPGHSYLPRGRSFDMQNCLGLGNGIEFSLESMMSEKGYSARRGTCQLSELRRLQQMDILWYSSHGIPYKIKLDPQGNPVRGYLLITGDIKKPCESLPQTECAANRSDIAGLRIIGGDLDTHGTEGWGITANFVRDYWSFKSTRSLVLIDACELFGRSTEPGSPFGEEFRQALGDKGAGLVFGWRDQVFQSGGDKIVKKFFDFGLGLNRETVLTPKFRPWMLGDVYSLMLSRGETVDSAAGGFARFRLEPQRLKLSGLMLAPTISFLVIDVQNDQVRINGDFGDEPGEVTISGVPVPILEWKPSQIKIRLARTGPASSGPLKVTVRGSFSNSVPITEWNGTVRVTSNWRNSYGAPGPKITINCSVRFREDFHRYRAHIDQQEPEWLGGSGPTLSIPERSSQCSWTWSEQGIDSQGDQTVVTGVGPSSAAPTWVDSSGFGFAVGLLPEQNAFSFYGLDVNPRGRAITTNPMGRVIRDATLDFGFDWSEFLARTFPMNPTVGTIDLNETKTIGDRGDPGTQTIHLQPSYMPDADTES